ncbi:MAG: hypothetical protein KDB53_18600, partial [Planctomycetes bacterium]|nr:hypothetical protein [Planctomycetota bacterium]
NLVIDRDRRVADLETELDATNGVFNRLFATAVPKFGTHNDPSGYPSLKRPGRNSFLVENILADFKRHDLGPNFHERNFDGSKTTQFITEPLWGVGTTGPYGHDGRSVTPKAVILRHGGEAQTSRDAFVSLPNRNQRAILEFLQTLVIFPPADTASTLSPGDPSNPDPTAGPRQHRPVRPVQQPLRQGVTP